MMHKIVLPLAAFATTLTSLAPACQAQNCCPTYGVRTQTVWVPRTETRYRIEYDVVEEEREITTYRSVPKTRYETRTRKVSKPVVETSTIEERYTVMKPVRTTEMVDRSYDETSYVTETSEREEVYTTYRPVVETHYQTRNRVVQRPVTETQYQTQNYTTYRPVTTYQNTVVDQGQYVAQQYYQPGDTRYHLRWMRGGYQTDPTGTAGYRRGGLGWVPYTSPGQTYAQLAYKPNPVQVAIPRTTVVPEVQQAQVPVQVTRMHTETVQEQVPVNITRMEAVQNVRKVPVTVQRPVTRRVERQVPVERVEWVEQEMVRPKEITRTSYKIEEVTEEIPIRYYETEAVTNKVKVPVRVARRVPYEVTVRVPQRVVTPMTLRYYDPYAVPLSSGSSSWMPASESTTVRYGDAYPANSLPPAKVRKEPTPDPFASPESDIRNSAKPEVNDPEVSEPADSLELEASGANDGPRA